MLAEDFGLGEEQRLLRDTVRAFARDKVAPRAAEIDREAAYPHDMFAALRDLGLFALPFPERYGGADSVLSGCLAIEELGRVCYTNDHRLEPMPIAADKPLSRLRGRPGGGPLPRQRERQAKPGKGARDAERPSPNPSRRAGGEHDETPPT